MEIIAYAAIIIAALGVCGTAIWLITTSSAARYKRALKRELARPHVAKDIDQAAMCLGELSLHATLAQDIGARQSQQDRACMTATPSALGFCVCDGMGGMLMGDQASQLAADILIACTAGPQPDPLASIVEGLHQANRAVYDLCEGHGGTTAVLARVDEAGLTYASVGDSRVYLYRENALSQLGQDHIFYYDLLRSGAMSPKEAAAHPEQEHLTSYIGAPELTRICTSADPIALTAGDRVLLVTDGVYKTLPHQELCDLCGRAETAQDILDAALQKALPRQDNLTAILLIISSEASSTILSEGGNA